MTSRSARRRGFTLVELLVAMALAITLLGVAVAVSQTAAFDSYRTVGAADKVSQWLIIAKNRALRDRQVRGVRVLATYQGTNQATASECQYVESPDPWTPQNANQFLVFQQVIDEADPSVLPVGTPVPGAKGLPADQKRVLSTRVFLCGTFTLSDFELDGATNAAALVRAGDTLYVPELGGRGFRIVGITVPPAAPTYLPGRQTATYPIQFHPQPNLTPTPTPYPISLAVGLNPPPAGTPVAPGVPGNSSPLTAAVELQLADAPIFTPAYSKFVRWASNGNGPGPAGSPPIVINPANPQWPNPVYVSPPALAASPTAVELPFGGDPTPPTPPNNPGYQSNPLNFQGGQFVDHRFPVMVTRSFGFYRAPRPLLGEPNLQIPGMVIDLNHSATNPQYGNYAPDLRNFPTAPPPPAPQPAVGTPFNVDILFAPSGEVVNAPHAITALLLRDPNRVPSLDLRPTLPGPTANPDFNFDTAGQMALVAVYTRTGSVATKPVAKPAAVTDDPFKFVKDGINGGL